jgi:hypothetical protein
MSDFDAYEDEMMWDTLDEDRLEQALAGRGPGDDPVLDDLARFARETRAGLVRMPRGRAEHLDRSASLLAPQGVPAARRAITDVAPTRMRRRLAVSNAWGGIGSKIAVAAVALVTTTGGLAVAGSLPDQAQDALARAAKQVGVDLPSSDEGSGGEQGGSGPADQASDTAKSVHETVDGHEGDRGCDFGHSVATAAGGQQGECQGTTEGQNQTSSTGSQDGDGTPDGAGQPEGTPTERPDGAGDGTGQPEGTPTERPDGTNQPQGVPSDGSDVAEEYSEGASSGRPDEAGEGRP